LNVKLTIVSCGWPSARVDFGRNPPRQLRATLPLFGDRNGAAQRNINLALNVPPSTGEDELIALVPSQILADGALPPVCRIRGSPRIARSWRAGSSVGADAV